MADVVSISKRSAMMAGIRAKDTKPEVILRRLLHRTGYRFRLHKRGLPGKPDLVLAKWNAVVFVHGCFWHGHESCDLFRLPKSRTDFWAAKIEGNQRRDTAKEGELIGSGWKVIIVWECALMKKRQLPKDDLLAAMESALRSGEPLIEIRGM